MKYLLVLAILCTASCGDSSATDPDAGTDAGSDAGPTVDAPPRMRPVMESLTYTPDGCAYEVATPELLEARMGGDAVGDAPTPAFVHVSWAGPTDSTMAISWRTDSETTVTQILYGTDRAAVEAADEADAAAGVSAQVGHHVFYRALTGEEVRQHEVHVCGLDAGTTYWYKVGGPGAWSAAYDVATGPAVGSTDPFRVAVAGDSRSGALVWAEIQKKVVEHAPDFQVFTGDAVELGVSQTDWDTWFTETYSGAQASEALARIPLMPANGNHEALGLPYVLQFALPQEVSGIERAEGEEWYSFDYGNVHFVVLNDSAAEAYIEAQTAWLDEDLGAVDRTATPWIVALHHKAPYSCSTAHGSQMDVRAAWQPVYDSHSVDLVLNGHDHIYERSKPIRGLAPDTMDGIVVAEGEGTVYVVTGGAGAPLYSLDELGCAHTELAESVNHYSFIDVADRTLTFTAHRLDGSVLDTFTLTK